MIISVTSQMFYFSLICRLHLIQLVIADKDDLPVVNAVSVVKEDLTTNSQILSLAIDDYLDNHIVFSNGSAIYTMNMDYNEIDLIAGSEISDYTEGVGAEARFKQISSIITGPEEDGSSLLVCDYTLPCIRSIDRRTNETSTIIGVCANGSSELPNNIIAIFRNSSEPNHYVILHHGVKKLLFATFVAGNKWNILEIGGVLDEFNDMHIEGLFMYGLNKERLSLVEFRFFNESDVLAISKPIASWPSEKFVVEKMLFFRENIIFITESANGSLMLYNLDNNLTKPSTHVSESIIFLCTDLLKKSLHAHCEFRSPSAIIRHPTDENTLLIGGLALYAVTLEGNLEENSKDGEQSRNEDVGEKSIGTYLLIAMIPVVIVLAALPLIWKHFFSEESKKTQKRREKNQKLPKMPTIL